jgi:diguanylate cyclase (GGDEF)-like protein
MIEARPHRAATPFSRSRDRGGKLSAVSGDRDAILILGDVTMGPRVQQTLGAAGYRLVQVADAEEAQRLSSEQPPAAILLAPARSGDPFAAVRALRENEWSAFVQLFVFAPMDSHVRTGDGVAAGADDVFVEPGDHDEAGERIVARIARSGALAQLALLDPLTELYNRRLLDERVPAELGRAARNGTLLSVAVLDLDGFKAINDTLGHAAGDRALVAFGQALRSSVRGYDLVGRYGGDEFIVLLPECGVEGLRVALGNLRARRSWALPGQPPLTFSAGLAVFPDDGTTWSALFEVADANARIAKGRGGNQIVGRDRR